jgi:hypothetical protein
MVVVGMIEEKMSETSLEIRWRNNGMAEANRRKIREFYVLADLTS